MTSIVSLVQLGFGGIVTALAVLSFRLMAQEGKKKDRDPVIYEQIQKYAGYTVKLALIVILGAIVDGGKDFSAKWLESSSHRRAQQGVTLSKQAQDCRESLTGLVGPETEGKGASDLRVVQRLTYDSCFNVMRQIEGLEARTP